MTRYLSDAQLAHLRASGLSDETIALAELETERDQLVVYRYLRWSPPKRWKGSELDDCLIFPCFEPGADQPYAHRVRPDRPRVETRRGKERERKYESPKGIGAVHYFPPRARTHGWLAGPGTKVWFEGEKKALLGEQLGYVSIGLTGVWNAHDARVRNPPGQPERSGPFVLHPRLKRHVGISDCDHIICFDSDAREKPDVMLAATVLGRMLLEAGARSVRLALPPSTPSGEKLGFDDYYMLIEQRGERGAEAIANLFATSEPIDPSYEAREGWKQELLTYEDGGPRRCLANVMTVLASHPAFANVLAYDDFQECVIKVRPPPVRAQDGSSSAGEWTEADATRVAAWIASNVGFEPNTMQVDQAVAAVAERVRVHPVRDYLRSLAWDKAPRLDAMLSVYFGAEDSEYTRGIGSRWMISAVARVMEPGCQVDCMLVLEGSQGIGKSTGLEALVGTQWYANTGINIGDKDSYQALRAKWVYEFAELDSLKGKEATRVKNFVSSATDNYRPSYGRRSRDFKRQTAFAGTTNESTYLADRTGNRRFWPVRCGRRIDVAALRRDRDQIWAEAFARYESGERWHADTEKLRTMLEQEQSERELEEPWLALVANWLDDPWVPAEAIGTGRRMLDLSVGVTTQEVMSGALDLAPRDMGRGAETRLGHVLKELGWEPRRLREGGERVRRYYRPADCPNCPNPSQPESEAGWDSESTVKQGSSKPVPTVPTESLSTYMREEENKSGKEISSLRKPVGPVGPVGTAPPASEWAGYFAQHRDELERLAADAHNDNAPRSTRPEGRHTTPRDWARNYWSHPDELEREARSHRQEAAQ